MNRFSPLIHVIAATLLSMSPALAISQGSQTLPSGYVTLEGTGLSSFPFNTAPDHKWHWHYDSGEFEMTHPILITEVYVRTKSNSLPITFDFPSVELLMSTSATDYTVNGQGGQPGHDLVFDSNFSGDERIVRAAAPFTGTNVPALTWMAFGLDEPFLYDPTQGDDFILQIRKCSSTIIWGASIDAVSGSAGQLGGNRYGDTSDCSGLTYNFSNNEFVPLIKFDWIPTGPKMVIEPMTAGELTDFDFTFVDPGGMIFIRWSTAGAGPTPSAVGDLLLSEPIQTPAVVHADASGALNFSTYIPLGLAGETFFVHSIVQRDGEFELTNALQIPVQ